MDTTIAKFYMKGQKSGYVLLVAFKRQTDRTIYRLSETDCRDMTSMDEKAFHTDHDYDTEQELRNAFLKQTGQPVE